MKHRRKRRISLALAVLMVLSLMPAIREPIWAADPVVRTDVFEFSSTSGRLLSNNFIRVGDLTDNAALDDMGISALTSSLSGITIDSEGSSTPQHIHKVTLYRGDSPDVDKDFISVSGVWDEETITVSGNEITIPDIDVTLSGFSFSFVYNDNAARFNKIEVQYSDFVPASRILLDKNSLLFTEEGEQILVTATAENDDASVSRFEWAIEGSDAFELLDEAKNLWSADHPYHGKVYVRCTPPIGSTDDAEATLFAIDPTDSSVYAECLLTYKPKDPAATDPDAPTNLTATYGDTLADVTLPVGWAWVDSPSTPVGNAGTQNFPANYSSTNPSINSASNVSLAIEVKKATPTDVIVPSGLSATYGDTLADVSLPTGWAWDDASSSVGNAGSNDFPATYTPSDSNYAQMQKTLTIAVQPATPTYTLPANLTATTGQTLADVSLPTGWAWDDPSTPVGDEGTNTFPATYTPNDSNYVQVQESLTITVQLLQPVAPSGLSATYGDTLADVSLPAGWAWDNPSDSVGSVSSAGNRFPASYTPPTASNYTSASAVMLAVTVNPATPAYTLPANLTATTGQTLADVSLPTGWAWDDPSTPVGDEGTNTFPASFTPSNPVNFTTVSETLSVTVSAASSGGSSSGGNNSSSSKEGIGSGTAGGNAYSWGDRANLSGDAATLYKFLVNNTVSKDENAEPLYPGIGADFILTKDGSFILATNDPDNPPQKIDSEILVCQADEPFYKANGDGKVDGSTFGNSDFYTVGSGSGDTKIDYANLVVGDFVSNTTFNGIYVTKLQKAGNPTYDADLAQLKNDVIASFRAFEFDHPEVFWLTGSIKLRVITTTVNGVQSAYLFLTLVDDSGFNMRIPEYAAPGAIEAAIVQREEAVNAIIAQIPADATVREKITNLNKWFTLHNEYNRSADLSTIGYTPHRSLKALMGNYGTNGPVCDGYSRAFKTVCDRIGIPVVLDTGIASNGKVTELHMWLRAQVDGVWYAVDCTWNDPIVQGRDGAISGFENEKYLLVGDDTVIDGVKFGVSHPSNKTVGGTTGVLFANLLLNNASVDNYLPVTFEDVSLRDWFYDYVKDAYNKNLMAGTSVSPGKNFFSPQGTATRGQIVQILYNAAGQPEVTDVRVDGWYGKAATWALDKGIVAGYTDGGFHGDDPVTREQLATILWAYEGAPQMSGTLDYADAASVHDYAVSALLWAKEQGIMSGKLDNKIDPLGTATRAEIATVFSNFVK